MLNLKQSGINSWKNKTGINKLNRGLYEICNWSNSYSVTNESRVWSTITW